jgi:hypothetical protein
VSREPWFRNAYPGTLAHWTNHEAMSLYKDVVTT